MADADSPRPRSGARWQRWRAGARNVRELLREGRLTEPYHAPFDIAHEGTDYRLRHYGTPSSAQPVGPLLLVPPLMLTAGIYDISPELSAVTWLADRGVDVWLVDFGAPEDEREGLARTLDDHILAVNDAVDEVRRRTGRDVHLAGYSQGGLFVYQVAAFRRSQGLASLITMGSPVDMRRNLPVPLYEDVAERFLHGAWRAISRPMEAVEGLPGALTSWGFKIVSIRREADQWLQMLSILHDREALERREAQRSFLGGGGFVWWPGPAFRTFVDQVLVANRLTSGGFVVDGRVVSLDDLTTPVLTFVGERDDFANPIAVRAIRRVAPNAQVEEISMDTGHFGLVVGSRALEATWPTVAQWIHDGGRLRAEETPATEDEPRGSDLMTGPAWRRVRAIWPAWQRAGRLAQELTGLWEVVQFDRPRQLRVRRGRSRVAFGVGWALSRSAREMPDDPFLLSGTRAFTLGEARLRVDRLAALLLDAGVKPGHTVALDLPETPEYLTAVCAISRLGGTLQPGTVDGPAGIGVDVRLADASSPHRDAIPLTVCLGAPPSAGEKPDDNPPVVIPFTTLDAADDETGRTSDEWGRADPEAIALWIPDSTALTDPLAITNTQWSAAALHTAVACRLRPGDTLWCALPLSSPLALLCALPPALIARSRLALGSQNDEALWARLRRAGATVLFLSHADAEARLAEPAAESDRQHRVRCLVLDSHDSGLAREIRQRFGIRRILGGRIAAERSRPSPLDLDVLVGSD